MQKISPKLTTKLQQEIKELPNQGLVQAVLEQRRLGGIYSDDPERYIVIKTAGPYTFLAGHVESKEILTICSFLSTLGNI